MDPKHHWEEVYATKAPDAVSWYAAHLDESLKYIRQTGLGRSAAVIDVGGGESTLVDDLIDAGYQKLTVLDISARALEVAAARLGPKAAGVCWIASDVLRWNCPPQSVDVWHDRAVFHFLTTDEQRQAYVLQVLRALKPGGFAIVGTFGPHGPDMCSGLPVSRYAPEELHGTFGRQFRLVDHGLHIHRTPSGSPQEFVYCLCRLEP